MIRVTRGKRGDFGAMVGFIYILFCGLLFTPIMGFAAQTIDIKNLHPQTILDVEAYDSDEARDQRGLAYTKLYAKHSIGYGIGISLVELDRNILRGDPLGSGVTENKWREVTKGAPQGAVRLISSGGWGDEEGKENGFPVALEVNRPSTTGVDAGSRIIGFFRFHGYMCFVDTRGKYATYEYFDEAFRLILGRLGWQ